MNVCIYYFLLLQNGFRSEQEAACEVMWDGFGGGVGGGEGGVILLRPNTNYNERSRRTHAV